MFAKLRKKFIVIAVCSVSAVLVLILGGINAINYADLVRRADETVASLREGGGSGHREPSPEAPFSTRFFTVTLSADGSVQAVSVDRAGVSEQQAGEAARAVAASGRTRGFYGVYRYGARETESGILYLFADCTVELENFSLFLTVSLAVGGGGLLVVFVLIFVFSGRVLAPVAESYRKQKQFVTDAGHEIKTPLTIIGANAEILEMQNGENEWTREIKEQIRRLSSLTEKLIFLARMDEESRVPLFDFSLSDAVREEVSGFSAVAAARGVRLSAEIQDGMTLCGNEEMLRRLTGILIDNALKYTDGDWVRVSLSAEGGRAVLIVQNPASSLPEGDLAALFERFRRGDPSRNSGTGGHGIGLAVARAVAELHRGRISGLCREGVVSFTVRL